MIDLAKHKLENELDEQFDVLTDLSDFQLATIGGGVGDVLWG